MYRGTTPTITFNVNIDTSKLCLERTYITIICGDAELELTGERIKTAEGEIAVTLTQAETLSLNDEVVKMQIRTVLDDGATALASNVINTKLREILKDGEI